MKLTLVRLTERDGACAGVLMLDGRPLFATLELAWNDNKKNESCIPLGRYTAKRVQSPKFGDTFEIMDVPGRSLIRFHWGNTIEDTEGCPLIGMTWKFRPDEIVLWDSKRAVQRFLSKMYMVEECPIEIISPYSSCSSSCSPERLAEISKGRVKKKVKI